MRKRKVLVPIVLGLFVLFAFIVSTTKPAIGENLTVTTYYPSPHGVYKALNVSELILKPLDEVPTEPTEGMIFYSTGKAKDDKGNKIDKGIWICSGDRWYPLMLLEERTKK
ncbi:MAG: hypothetical protein KAS05_00415 [Candidatus Omnitrophica bacterium]|nr:hypothetical protein [Candidatus Omnitrophota bacterium]